MQGLRGLQLGCMLSWLLWQALFPGKYHSHLQPPHHCPLQGLASWILISPNFLAASDPVLTSES